MKKIDLGESPEVAVSSGRRNKKWYPSINFGDNGHKGEPTMDAKQVGKKVKVTATIKLTSINSRVDSPSGKHFDYSFDVLDIEMPEKK